MKRQDQTRPDRSKGDERGACLPQCQCFHATLQEHVALLVHEMMSAKSRLAPFSHLQVPVVGEGPCTDYQGGVPFVTSCGCCTHRLRYNTYYLLRWIICNYLSFRKGEPRGSVGNSRALSHEHSTTLDAGLYNAGRYIRMRCKTRDPGPKLS